MVDIIRSWKLGDEQFRLNMREGLWGQFFSFEKLYKGKNTIPFVKRTNLNKESMKNFIASMPKMVDMLMREQEDGESEDQGEYDPSAPTKTMYSLKLWRDQHAVIRNFKGELYIGVHRIHVKSGDIIIPGFNLNKSQVQDLLKIVPEISAMLGVSTREPWMDFIESATATGSATASATSFGSASASGNTFKTLPKRALTAQEILSSENPDGPTTKKRKDQEDKAATGSKKKSTKGKTAAAKTSAAKFNPQQEEDSRQVVLNKDTGTLDVIVINDPTPSPRKHRSTNSLQAQRDEEEEEPVLEEEVEEEAPYGYEEEEGKKTDSDIYWPC